MQSKKMTRTPRRKRGTSDKQKGNEESKEIKERNNGGRAKGGQEDEKIKKSKDGQERRVSERAIVFRRKVNYL
jgi:hypothetical protein